MSADIEQKLEYFKKIQKANHEGYAGCMPNGNLVDRREHPEAYPVAANGLFGVTKPRCIKCTNPKAINQLKDSVCDDCSTTKD